MQLEGQVIDIIYKNDINSYTVATFETSEQEETTIVGYLPFVNEGDNLKITGDIVKHPDYGEQFKIATFEKTMPTTPEAIHYLMKNGVFYAPGKASNAGGVACSGLEMSQNAQHLSWTAEEVDQKIENIMVNIFETCRDTAKEYGHEKEYVVGANIAGFLKVAKAMKAQGTV